jgi:hypothetical protein
MSIVLDAVVILTATLAGAWLHEAIHYVTARALGRRARVDWLRLNVRWENPTPRTEPLVGLAPLAVGLSVGVAVVISGIAWPWTLWPGWLLFTCGGGLADYSAIVDRLDLSTAAVQLSGSCIAMLALWALMLLDGYGLVGGLMYWLAWPVTVIAAVSTMIVGFLNAEPQHDPA